MMRMETAMVNQDSGRKTPHSMKHELLNALIEGNGPSGERSTTNEIVEIRRS